MKTASKKNFNPVTGDDGFMVLLLSMSEADCLARQHAEPPSQRTTTASPARLPREYEGTSHKPATASSRQDWWCRVINLKLERGIPWSRSRDVRSFE